jgi:hypothetical protein
MMPVPVEFEAQVRQMVMWFALMENSPSWNPDRIDTHLRTLDADARALACEVASAVVAGKYPEDTKLADRFGLSVRELLGLAHEVNAATFQPFPGPLFLSVQGKKLADDDGGGTRHVLYMHGPFARMVCQWADAHGSLLTWTAERQA